MKILFIKLCLLGILIETIQARSFTGDIPQPRNPSNFGPDIKNLVDKDPDYEPIPDENPVEIATKYIEKRNGKYKAKSKITGFHTSQHNDVTHVYLQQTINGIEVCNGLANVNIDKNGKIISSGISYYRKAPPRPYDPLSDQLISAPDAVVAFAKFLNLDDIPLASSLKVETQVENLTVTGAPFVRGPIPSKLKYLQIEGGKKLALVWCIDFDQEKDYYNAHVDANTGEILSSTNYAADASSSYTVFPLGLNDPDGGPRQTVKNPYHLLGSPLMWHSQGNGKDYTVTISNNVYAQDNPTGGTNYINNHRPEGGPNLVFDFPFKPKEAPRASLDAAITNLFYWNNLLHDLFYAYGFTEAAGNFQENNLDRGGIGGDAVIAFAQDGGGTNNAHFRTLPDGQRGTMWMYIFTRTNPYRDGDFDNGVIIHEYAHGLSNRLTGGPMMVSCLSRGEAGGMGEGWGDFIATILRTNASTKESDNFPAGSYVLGRPAGIRHYVYSTSLSTNPTTYSYLKKSGYDEVHSIGEIWCSLLFEVYWNLVKKHKYSSDWFYPESAKKGGNKIMLQLVIDGMKLQPCNPTFIDARNAILKADEIKYAGSNKCQIWRGFAKRGLGYGAGPSGAQECSIPPECPQPRPPYPCT